MIAMHDPSAGFRQAQPASSGQAGLQYFLSDHLGSIVVVTDASGTLISQQRYLPFGGVRENVGNITQTDYGYTGQRNLDSGIGLMDYKARFYSPYINRFIQPDTIVPGMFNPQNLNRYSYVRNNPIRYTDPSGHVIGKALYAGDADLAFSQVYGIKFTGDFSKNGWGKSQNILAVVEAVKKVGKKFTESSGGSSGDAFKEVYGAVHFQWGKCGECNGAGGYAYGYQKKEGYYLIAFESITGIKSDDTIERGVKNVVHELGHIYDWTHYDRVTDTRASNRMSSDFTRDVLLRPNITTSEGTRWDWQQSPSNERNEIFADMFIAWTYNAWNTSADPLTVEVVKNANTWMNGLANP
jgi:RHS repeat-associated protein